MRMRLGRKILMNSATAARSSTPRSLNNSHPPIPHLLEKHTTLIASLMQPNAPLSKHWGLIKKSLHHPYAATEDAAQTPSGKATNKKV